MRIARPTVPTSIYIFSDRDSSLPFNPNSMSQDYNRHHNQAIFFLPNGFDRSAITQQEQQQHQPPEEQQLRRDNLRLQGFEPDSPLVGVEQPDVYETAGMLSEMFSYGNGPGSAAELLEHDQLQTNYQNPRMPVTGLSSEWYGGRHNRESLSQQQISSINPNSAAAMKLFLTNPQPRRPSPPPPPPPPPPAASSSTLHMLLPNPPGFHSIGSAATNPVAAGFSDSVIAQSQITWVHDSATPDGGGPMAEIGGIMEGQGLSLTLSSLQHLEATKAKELGNMGGDGGVLFFNQARGARAASSNTANQYSFKNLQSGGHRQHQTGHRYPAHFGFGSSFGVPNVLGNSKYAKPAQELLEEFCSVGRVHLKKTKLGKKHPHPSYPSAASDGCGSAGSSSSSKDALPLSTADRVDHQRRKVKLLSMLDEVDTRYNIYSEQMQMVVSSFDLVMGSAAAVPYTALAQKAMSRHFRCLKDAIEAQLRHSSELLGGLTKGETPRLKLLEQSFRQQRAFHPVQCLMEQEAWRPQRGLPERSVNVLRAWLFEHFLHPYPSDADKLMLARQTGLSRNQVSNWFINARVRLWKPMVEELYLQEADDEDEAARHRSERDQSTSATDATPSTNSSSLNVTAQTPTPAAPPPATEASATATITPTAAATGKRSKFNASENDPSLLAIDRRCSFLDTQAKHLRSQPPPLATPPAMPASPAVSSRGFPSEVHHHRTLNSADRNTRLDFGSGATAAASGGADKIMGSNAATTLTRFGTTSAAGDVSLTLGLRNAGNSSETSVFPLRGFHS
ncbi:hypothetical protein Nepgr_025949 [Nepenthes gracilis]|uniref:Homeobox domain-containing protein n=1 Tax=Nepenthes gracilis TaxID=150966 RepID=A0AAD3Y208_NEPGR|nr:hypothetical protein Nepgr_025949 [Nepenthes gracilis]